MNVFRDTSSLLKSNSYEYILVVDDDECIRFLFLKKLERLGFKALGASTPKEALKLLSQFRVKAVLLDQFLGDELGTQLIDQIIETSPFSKVVFLTSHESIQLATRAMSLGASGFLLKSEPVENNIEKFLQIIDAEDDSVEDSEEVLELSGLVGKSPRLKQLLHKVKMIHNSDTTILLTGESGVGKEMFAKTIHRLSDRRDEPFIAINCAAISENLLEAELFGARKGAFTDARADRKGYFETCTNGTLLLDEIGETSPALQAKLLRVLQEKEVTPVGSCHPIKVNTRVIAATNRNLRDDVVNKLFREDLFYRLAVISLEIPPLRDRSEDIPILTEHFLRKFNKKLHKKVKPPTSEIYARLKAYTWPGNIRELYNAIERAVLLAQNNKMKIEDLLPYQEINGEGELHDGMQVDNLPLDYSDAKDLFEKLYIENLLKTTNYNITDAAKISHQYRTNIYRLIRKHNINIERKAT